MIRVRVLCPSEHTADVVDVLRDEPGATHVVVLPGSAVEPAGDVVEADLAREAVEGSWSTCGPSGWTVTGGIDLLALDTVVSGFADRAEEAAPGEGADAIVWEQLGANVVGIVVAGLVVLLLAGRRGRAAVTRRRGRRPHTA